MIDIRDKVRVGNLVNYHQEEYIISGLWFDCGGNAMIADLIKPTEGNNFRFVKHIYDMQIEDCRIVKSK